MIRNFDLSIASTAPLGANALSRAFTALSVLLLVVCLAMSLDASGAVAGVAMAALALCAAFDVVQMRIPNPLTYTGTVLVLLQAVMNGADSSEDAVTGMIVGGGFMLAITFITRGKVGLGDAKLTALGGSLVGVNFVLLGLFLGTLTAAIVYVALLLMGRVERNQALPYAPFLAVGFIVVGLATGTTLGLG